VKDRDIYYRNCMTAGNRNTRRHVLHNKAITVGQLGSNLVLLTFLYAKAEFTAMRC
jgi:hypothetical protein